MATKQAGALSTLKAKPVYGEVVEEDDDVDAAMRRVMDAYTARQQRNYDPGLMAIAQGLLSSKGNFGEAAGMAAKNYQDVQSQLRQEDIETAQAELQLAQSRRDQSLMRKKMDAARGLFGGEPVAPAGEMVDQNALSAFVDAGMPEDAALKMLASHNVPPNATAASSGGMDMNKLAKYIFANGYDENAKAAMEMLKLQNQRYSLQNGQVIEPSTGKVRYAEPEGLPPSGERNIEIPMGEMGTLKGDLRTQKLWEFANAQGPEMAKTFAQSYQKNGVVPASIEQMYNERKRAPVGGMAASEELSPEELSAALIGIQMKSTAGKPTAGAAPSDLPTSNLKDVTFTPTEKKVITSMGRLMKTPPEQWTALDKQVLQAAKQSAVPLNEPAAEAVPAKAAVAPAKAPAPAPSPAPAPAANVAPPVAAGAPTPPRIIPVPALPTNPSAEQKSTWEANKATIEAQNRAAQDQYKLQMEQYNKDQNRLKDVAANVEEAGRKKQVELAATKEQAFLDSLTVARQMKGASSRVLNNVIMSPAGIGILSEPGFFNAVGSLVANGFTMGSTSFKLADAETALAQVMPISGKDLQNRAVIAKDLAELELLYSRVFFSGQGPVTESERRIVQKLGGSVSDNPQVLARQMELIAKKADYEARKVEAFQEWRKDKKNDTLTINDWMSSKEAKSIDKAYDRATNDLYGKFFGAPPAKAAEGAAVVPQLKNAREALLESLKRK